MEQTTSNPTSTFKIRNDGKTAYQCWCPEDARAFLEEAGRQGFDFVDGDSHPSKTLYWDEYRENTCYVVTKGDTIFVYHARYAKAQGLGVQSFFKK